MKADMPFKLPIFECGRVWLVGAGPGDPGLLTLHAVNAIKQADYILYDALVDKTCLDFAQEGCKLEFVGKRGGQISPQQTEINDLMIELAKKNFRVLRLKGGDPFVFGRGGEESRALEKAGIPFRVIPGVTAGIAGPAYAGIPITHRTVSQSVTFLTGHDADGNLPKTFNWQAISDGAQILIFYMALRHIKQIAKELIEAGRAGDEVVTFISNATTPAQTIIDTDLQCVAESDIATTIKAPTIVVVGQTIRLADAAFNTFEGEQR